MILINLTGLDKWHWMPVVLRKSDGFGIWFIELKRLGVEVEVCSVKMATEFINRLNAIAKEADNGN